MTLLRIIVITPWEKGVVIRIPLVPQTRFEWKADHQPHFWTEHRYEQGTAKV